MALAKPNLSSAGMPLQSWLRATIIHPHAARWPAKRMILGNRDTGGFASRSGVVRGLSDLSLRAVKASNLGALALAKLDRCEALDKAHGALTARTFPQNLGCCRRWRRERGTHK